MPFPEQPAKQRVCQAVAPDAGRLAAACVDVCALFHSIQLGDAPCSPGQPMLLAYGLLCNASRPLCGWGPHLDAARDDQVVAGDGTYMILPCRRSAPADSHLQTVAASTLTQASDGKAARDLTPVPDGEARQRLLLRLLLADSSGGTAGPTR